MSDYEDEYGPVCPDTGQYAEDCLLCQGEACELCGAGLSNDAPHCEHDVVERHTDALRHRCPTCNQPKGTHIYGCPASY